VIDEWLHTEMVFTHLASPI